MRRAGLLPIWLVAAAMAVPFLGASSPLMEVDDARYAEVPRAMAASGDWVLPALNGMPYVEKPPLWYWIAATSYKLFGVSEAAARVPMALLSLLGLIGVWWLGSWLFSPGVGRVAATATATTSLWAFLAHNLTLDLPVSVFLLWATAFALRAMKRPQDARWAAPGAWTAAALAFLSKGLIALLLPALWIGGLCVLFPRLRRGARALLSPLGILLACALVVPWLAAMQSRRPDFLRVFFLEQHFQRYLTPKYNRGGAWWYYLAVLPAGLMPWTAPALAGLLRAVRRPFGPDERGPALAAWVLSLGAFFTTSHSKLATYILPAVPHAALLAAVALDEGLPAWAAALQRACGVLLLAAAGATLAARVWFAPHLEAFGPAALPALAFAMSAALGTALLVSCSVKRPAAPLAGGGVIAGVCLLASLSLVSPLLSAREISLAVRADIRPEDELWTYGTYLHGLPFYTGHLVDKLVYFVGEFHYAKEDPAYAERFGDDNAVRALPRAGGKTFVVLRTAERDHFEKTVGGASAAVAWRGFGRWSLAVVPRR